MTWTKFYIHGQGTQPQWILEELSGKSVQFSNVVLTLIATLQFLHVGIQVDQETIHAAKS